MYLLHSSSTQPYLLSEDISKDLSKNGPKKKKGGIWGFLNTQDTLVEKQAYI